MMRKDIVRVGSLKIGVLALSLVLGFVFSCAKKEEHVHMPDYGPKVIQQDGKTIAQPSDNASSLFQQGKFEDLRKNVCGTNGCSDELQTYANEPTVNAYVTVINMMILFKRLDSALSTLCGVAGGSLGSICATSSAPYEKISITPKQTDVIDTLLNIVGLKRDEITQLMTEVAIATENYIKKGDKNFVFAITVPFNVKVGNLVNVWFKAGTEIRWDHMNILGSVAQLVLALFNVINSHDWNLDINQIISNASKLLGDLSNDPAGFIRNIPGTLGIDKAPNFLRFKSGGEDTWKQIPTNISKALTWAGNGAKYFFDNPCKDNDPALACWQKGATSLAIRFNLDPQKENVFMGGKATGVLTLLEGGFSDKMTNTVVAVLKNGGGKFNCSNQDNLINVAGQENEFDIQKVVSAVGSLIEGFSISITLPNFARIDVCKIFGAKEGSTPLPIRDLILPAEYGDDNKLVEAGKYFAFEVEASRKFYEKAITNFNTSQNPFYFTNLTQSQYIVFSLVLSGGYSDNTTKFYFDGVSLLYIPSSSNLTYVKAPTSDEESALFFTSPSYFFYSLFPFMRSSDTFNTGVPSNAIALMVPERYVKKPYVARGDWDRFTYLEGITIRRDYFEPLTTYLTSVAWFSNYPKDVVSSLSAILSEAGLKFIPYVLFKEKDGKVLNGAVEIDNCIVIWEFANAVSDLFVTNKISADDYNFLRGIIINPFLVERVAGLDVLKAFRQINEQLPPNIIQQVKYLSDSQTDKCGIYVGEGGATIGIGQPARNFKFRTATNQIINDLIGIGLFAISANNALK